MPQEIDSVYEQNKAILEEVTAGGTKPEALESFLFPQETGAISTADAVETVTKADETLKGLTSTNDKVRAEAVGIDTKVSGWLDRLREAESKTGERDEEGLAAIFEEDDRQLKKTGEVLDAAAKQANEYREELKSLATEIDSFKITDAQLNEQISAITNRWNARIEEMRDINMRREKAFETLGFRTGARFSGGVRGGVFGGVIAEEERAGILRIGQLEAQKQQEISGARTAQRQQNWNVYVKKADMAQDVYEQQLEEVTRLNKLYIEQQKELKKERQAADKVTRQVSIDNAVAGLWQQGITDPATILDYLNYTDQGEMIGDVGIADIQKSIEFFEKMKPENLLKSASQEVRDFAIFFPDLSLNTPEGLEQFMAFRKQMAGPSGSSDVKDFQLFFPDSKISTPEGYQQFLRYKAQIAAAGRKPGGDGDRETPLTPTEKRELEQAKILSAPVEVQDYFLNTEPAFRDWWTRNVADKRDFTITLEDMNTNYTYWWETIKAQKPPKAESEGDELFNRPPGT